MTINSLVFRDLVQTDFDCKEELKNYKGAVLIIQGKHDIISEKIALTSKEVFVNSKLILLENTGHYGWLDNPKAYFSTLSDFLSDL